MAKLTAEQQRIVAEHKTLCRILFYRAVKRRPQSHRSVMRRLAPDLRAEYRWLRQTKRIPVAEAMEIVAKIPTRRSL